MNHKFTTDETNLSELMKMAENGELQLPNFQRPYKWKTSAVMKLLDSIHKAHPAGALLFLERDKNLKFAYEKIRSVETAQEDISEPNFLVLDGQQRLTSCHSVYYNRGMNTYFLDLNQLYENFSEDFEKMDLLEDKIIVAKKHIDQPDAYLFDNDLLPFSFLKTKKEYRDRIVSYRKNLREAGDRDQFLDFIEMQLENFLDPFFDYLFPVIKLPAGLTIEGVCKVFQSINTTGLKLTAYDICVATFMPDGLNLKQMLDSVVDDNSDLQPLIAGDKTIILQVIAMLANRSPKKNNLPKELRAQDIRDEWGNAVTGMISVVEVFDQIGVGLSYGTQLVPYFPMIPVVAAALVKKGYVDKSQLEQAEMRNKIRKWYYKVSLETRYTEGTDNKMKEDYAMLKLWLDSNDEPEVIASPLYLAMAKVAMANKNGAFGKAILTIMNAQELKDFYSNENVGYNSGLQTKSQLHHVFPKAAFKENANINSVFNFAYLTAESNKFIRDKKPSVYIPELSEKLGDHEFLSILKSHFISEDAVGKLQDDNYNAFIAIRIKLFANYLTDIVGLNVEFPEDSKEDEFDNDDNFVPE